MQHQRKISKAKFKNNTREEKRLLRELIWKHSDAGNNAGTVEAAEEYIKKFDDQDAWVWNMVYVGNSDMGKTQAAQDALKRALELQPDDSSLIYNYSLLIERKSSKDALEYLESQNETVKNDPTVKSKIVMLKKDCGIDSKEEAKEIVSEYKNKTVYFSDFDKRVLLPGIFRIAGEKYSYVDPKVNRSKNDEQSYLVSKGNVQKL